MENCTSHTAAPCDIVISTIKLVRGGKNEYQTFHVLQNQSLATAYSYLKGVGNSITGLVKRITMLDGNTFRYTYDEAGNITSITRNEEDEPFATYEYDELNQLVRENRADLNLTYI